MPFSTFLAYSLSAVTSVHEGQNTSTDFSAAPERRYKNLVTIDTDAGIDDAWALFMALKAHNDPSSSIRILAITTTHGNTSVDNVTKNVTRVLETVKETKIPVYRGAVEPLTIRFMENPPYNGEDGFGDANLPPIKPVLAKGHAVNKLIQLAKEHPGKITVLAIGPLTNLALAIRLKPKIKFKKIIIMGGTIEGQGNVTPAGEFNFVSDAEAARTTLEAYKCPIIVCPWEICVKYGTTTKNFRTQDLGNLGTPEIDLLNKIEAKLIDSTKTDTWRAVDSVAVAYLLNPAFSIKTEKYYCTVELKGEFTRGMMVVDKEGLLGHPPNVTILTEFDTKVYKEMLWKAAGGEGSLSV